MKEEFNKIPNDEIEERKAKTRKLSVLEASAYSVSDGFGIKNVSPYLISLNASNSLIGLLSSLSSLLGNSAQLLTLKLVNKFSRKKIVSVSIFLQSIFWLLLIIPGILFMTSFGDSQIPAIVLVALYVSLIVSGAISGPAWTSWMKDLVPQNILGRYFANRNRIAGIISFSCMLVAGIILDHFKKSEVMYGFFILFAFSAVFRSISAFLFTKHYEPEFKPEKSSYFSFSQFVRNMPFNNFGKFALFIALVNFSVAIASPFFAVFLLKQRAFSYTYLMIWTMIAPIATILIMPFWGKLSDGIGNIKIMRLTGLFTAIIPFIYLIASFIPTNNFLFLFLIISIELVSGIAWGGFNLAVANSLYKFVSREKIIYCSAYMNLLIGIGVFFGATIGGAIASVSYWNPILLVFIVSGIVRVAVQLIMLPKLKETTEEKFNYDKKGFLPDLTFIGETIGFFRKSYITETMASYRKQNSLKKTFSMLQKIK